MTKGYTRKNSLRLHGYDYRLVGTYFITLCVERREALFGVVESGEMKLNQFGEIVKEEWLKTAVIRHAVALVEFVIMPNHLHAIIILNDTFVGPYASPPDVGAAGVPPAPSSWNNQGSHDNKSYPKTTTLGNIIGGFKRATTKRINEIRGTTGAEVWQRSFYDRIIRNEHELGLARQYIMDNPLNWELDKENPDLQGVYWEE